MILLNHVFTFKTSRLYKVGHKCRWATVSSSDGSIKQPTVKLWKHCSGSSESDFNLIFASSVFLVIVKHADEINSGLTRTVNTYSSVALFSSAIWGPWVYLDLQMSNLQMSPTVLAGIHAVCFDLSEAGWRCGSVGPSVQPPGPAGKAALQSADQRIQHSHRLDHSQYTLSRELTVHLLHTSAKLFFCVALTDCCLDDVSHRVYL